MIITTEQLKEVSGCDYYDGSLIHDRFAYKIFKKQVVPIGNIVAFRAPMEVTENLVDLEDSLNKDYIYSEDALNFCIELPITNLYGGVCFQRLFNHILGTAISQVVEAPVEMKGDDIMIHKEHDQGGVIQQQGKCSVSIACEKNGAILIHTGINVKAGDKAPAFAFSTNLTDEQCQDIMTYACDMFYNTSHDLFVSTSKVI